MINIVNKVDCCGCSACKNICPKNCIEMIADKEGFLYPSVDKKKCVNCRLCETACPILHYEVEKENKAQLGAIVVSRDETVLAQSTSGGAFTAIAEYVISCGGYVYGVEMNSDFFVHHIEVSDVMNLVKFRNSKYVQSDIGSIYKMVESRLKSGVLVCFSGTPCQIEGLRHFLRKDYENLILVDVVCRAVPSPGVWNRYIHYIQEKYGSLSNVRFRDKDLGYQYSTMKIQSSDGKILRNGIESDQWLRMFFSGMIIRPSCTDCKFRRMYRNSDITIWDCFNVSDLSKNFDETKGATRMLIHSEKGKMVFDSIANKYHYEMMSPDMLVRGLTELSKSPQEHALKKQFFEDYHLLSMEELLNKYFANTLSVKIKKNARLFLNKLGIDKVVKKMKRKLSRSVYSR